MDKQHRRQTIILPANIPHPNPLTNTPTQAILNPMPTDAIIVAAGSSRRFGPADKLTANLLGRPVIAWTLAAFQATSGLGNLIIVTAPGREAEYHQIAAQTCPRAQWRIVTGGPRRRDSVEAGLHAATTTYVAIHDGARPLVTPTLIQRVIAAAQGRPGAVAAVPVTDTIKEVHHGIITAHPDRSHLWAAQTPQVVLRQAWLQAAATSDNDETDDAAMLSRLGLQCTVVESSSDNLKITRPIDLELAAQILTTRESAP